MTDQQPPAFVPVSPKYVRVELIGWAIFFLVILVPVVLPAIISANTATLWVLWAGLAAWVLFVVVVLIVVPRSIRALGYAEREDDILIRRGIMWRKITVVPYGRLQYVEVESGPVERGFGLATVKLHTASAESDAQIRGLPRVDAERLRDEIAARGSAALAGL